MPSLEEAIAEATTELEKQIPPKEEKLKVVLPGKEEQQEEEQEEVESDDETTQVEEEELDDASKDEAFRLYKALKDPKAGPAVLAALAQQAGLLGKNTPETKTEVREAKKAVKEILKDSLPENMKFLADQLGPAIEAVFEQEREEQQEKFQQIEIQRVESQVVAAYERVS